MQSFVSITRGWGSRCYVSINGRRVDMRAYGFPKKYVTPTQAFQFSRRWGGQNRLPR